MQANAKKPLHGDINNSMNFADLSLTRGSAYRCGKKALQFKLQIQITQNKYEITFSLPHVRQH
jgi:hypothetical protein